MKKSFLILALAVSGCANLGSIIPPNIPTTQPLTREQAQADLSVIQNDLTLAENILNLAHTAGAFSTPAQWSTVQTYEASAQQAINLAQAAVDDPTITDLNSFLVAANDAVQVFKNQAQKN